MNVKYDEFIGVFQDVFPEDFCEKLIESFDNQEFLGAGYDRIQSENALKHDKEDYQLNALHWDLGEYDGIRIQNVFFDGLQRCYEQYVQKYSNLTTLNVRSSSMKMQRTGPGQGYHLWHSEQGNTDESKARCLVYMLYLNTLGEDDGGETEFLYQRKRYKPVKNTMIIWPASFTHTHRGNTVLGINSKYVVTGWFLLT